MTDDALRAIWSTAAPAWGQHAAYVDARGGVVATAMLDAVALRPGDHVLELGCGPGGVGLAAARVVGPQGRVVLSDFAAEMTAVAKARAAASECDNVTVAEFDMVALDCPDASFDVVLCREALMLIPEPATAVAEARRVVKPGGRVAFAVWGPRDRNPWLGVLLDAISRRLGVPIPPEGVRGPFALSNSNAVPELLTAAGLCDVDALEVATPMRAESFEQWWSVVPSLAGPVGPLLQSLPAELTAAIREDANE